MNQQLTEMREIYKYTYIVRDVQMAMDKTKALYNLHEILDPAVGLLCHFHHQSIKKDHILISLYTNGSLKIINIFQAYQKGDGASLT